MKKASMAPLGSILEFKRNMLQEIRAKQNVTHMLLIVLLCIVVSVLVAVVVIKLVKKLNRDEYELYEDFDDLNDIEFDDDDVLADEGDFVK